MSTTATIVTVLLYLLHLSLQITVLVRVLLRPHRQPASRVAWVVVVLVFPVVGMLAYLFFGEVGIGRSRVARLRAVLARLPAPPPGHPPDVPERYAHLFRFGESICDYRAVGGNRGQLMADSDATIDALVADIDAARDHVHVLFYIWLADRNGCRVASALSRAAARGVTCRAMADDLGARALIRSPHWRAMREAGVRLATALPIGNPLMRPIKGRIDLRNHRKIVVIDDRITYCGSQNCADPEFRVKPRYAPWVDAVIRFEGPIARYNQHLFASDWMSHVDDPLDELLARPLPQAHPDGFAAQVIGTGPTVRYSAMPEVFETLMHTARRELVITTPYYVPDESMQDALCAAAYRGVATTLILPAHNDSLIVGAASRSYYAGLLEAGVRIFEFEPGLLHTKSLTLDGAVALIGSANLDRRSFELNYENNILFHDPTLTAALRARQQDYLAQSREITRAAVAAWSLPRHLVNNAVAMFGPVL
ncbi:cardiolipin synthase [Marichromatium sp. PS1]|uniref:cardiolipin synthase n=1 Tax=Marichromatium sp. PS1 TaxID=3138932 RepID=UPI0032E5C22D